MIYVLMLARVFNPYRLLWIALSEPVDYVSYSTYRGSHWRSLHLDAPVLENTYMSKITLSSTTGAT